MKISLKKSGGIGNIEIEGQIDTDKLTKDLADRISSVLDPSRLESAQTTKTDSVPDSQQYEISLIQEDELKQYKLNEEDTPPEVLEIIDELIGEIIRQKKASAEKDHP